MEGIRKSTLKFKERNRSKKDFENFLIEYSEVAFVYTAVPTFVLVLIGLLAGIILFFYKDQCEGKDDEVFAFLLGQMIFYYSFALIYANLLFQLIPNMNSLTVTFALYFVYFGTNTGWSLWGIEVISSPNNCIENSAYWGMSIFMIAFTLFMDILLICGIIVVYIQRKKARVAAEINIKSLENQPLEVSAIEEPFERSNQGLKEENFA
ncbi:hypothetical protein SteCoe_18974 [Stentor coeruleus]|uniref:Uncharacterized protein n=1 Tax=Stentor coeruleus TaxID=5963 RepID=A0A1R2BV68_9CILI|nr:hypothetical protein SteCoe_18974 [Stentor coeruleus]